ncbi:MAG: patatin-like phospholipase family protein [Myxococcaceae bacterium]
MSASSVALVFSGGGARGAYEAGIVRYLREELPKSLGHQPRFDILCGTSVGAVTACYLAATMDRAESQGRELAALWESLSLEEVYGVHGADLWTLSRRMWRAATNDGPLAGWRLDHVLHPEPLEQMVRTQTDWKGIARNLAAGHLSALSVTATEIRSGKTVVFVQRREGGVPAWSRDPTTVARPAVIGPDHALASAAIPLLFRPVRVEQEFFCDGSLRQNTPLSPALRLGATRVLIVSLKTRSTRVSPTPTTTAYPTTPMLMGKLLNALLLDHTDYDLDRLRRFNGILESGQATFGPDFIERINETIRAARGQPYRLVQDLVLRPSQDIALIAAKHAKKDRLPALTSPSLPTKLLHRLAKSQLVAEGDLASYLLFDGAYARDLITLGMEDAHAQKDALTRFFAEA